MKEKARCFGQDIMKGEWGGRDLKTLDDTSKRILKGGRKDNGPGGCTRATAALMEIKGGFDDEKHHSGTSIFDPVLCELIYRWFSPPGGLVLDPFAGGSVRGIVAAKLCRKYIGVDLSARQIEANREQWETMSHEAVTNHARNPKIETGGTVTIKVSGPMLRQMFHPCIPDYIKANCNGRCCQGTGRIMVTIHPSETARIESLGAKVSGGFIVADERGLCPFKTEEGFCKIHGDDKPFGCKSSPFTLNENGTLIVRNRYRLLKCGKGDGRIPAYKAHRWSLAQIFGQPEADRIADKCESGVDAITATMPALYYAILKENDAAKHNMPTQIVGMPSDQCPVPLWHIGDSREIDTLCPDVQADLVFSCPPYADLEVYSDDQRDLSTMPYPIFLKAYQEIIKKSCAMLKDNRFACFVIGEVRDKKGMYYQFVPDTIKAFTACGLKYYNEAILVTAAGSLPIRVGKQFAVARKIGKTHQNVLVFIKGDPKKATADIGPVEFGDVAGGDEP